MNTSRCRSMLRVGVRSWTWLPGDAWGRCHGDPTYPGAHGIGKVAPRFGSGLVTAYAVRQKGHRQSMFWVAPANGGAEAAMPERTHGARRSRPMPPRVG